MATFSSANQLAERQEKRAKDTRHFIETQNAELALETYVYARSLLGGNVSTKELAALGHPFGRNAPSAAARGRRLGPIRGNLPRLPINRQSGGVEERLEIKREDAGNGNITYTLRDTDPAAVFVLALGGTRNMAARGFWPAVRAYYKQRSAARLKAAMKAGTQGE